MIENSESLSKYVAKRQNELQQKLKMVSKGGTSTTELIRSISDALPGDTRVDVNTLTIDERQFVLEGVLYQGQIDPITQGLEKIRDLENVKLQMDGQRFVFRGNVTRK